MTWWEERPTADSNDEECDVEAVCGSEERVVDDVWDGGDGSTERQMRFGHCRVTLQPITERESDNCGTEADWPGAGRVHPKPPSAPFLAVAGHVFHQSQEGGETSSDVHAGYVSLVSSHHYSYTYCFVFG